MYFWIGIGLMAIAAFVGWCLCRISAISDRRMSEIFSLPSENGLEDVFGEDGE
jgi:hypothetical protein